MKERIIAISLFLLAVLTIWAITAKLPKKEYARPAADFTDAIREGTASSPSVSGEVIRLHILADSDSNRDQTIKLALRDVLLPYLNAATLSAASKEEAMTQLQTQCAFFTELANAALAELGAEYTATVSVQNLYFPIRIYGSQTYLSEDAVIFPPGYYDSVQVILGSGNGHNWWCLAYPSLCFIDSTYDYIPKGSEQYKLKIDKVPKGTLYKIFYGKALPEFPVDTELAPKKAGIGTSEDEVTVYFGSKLLELIKSSLKKKAR